jgi:hypothetical protein
MIPLMLVLFLGCASDPHDYKIPTDTKAWEGDPVFKETMAKLTQEEREDLARYSMRKVLTGGIPADVTVSSALQDQKEFVAKAIADKAEQDLLAAKMKAEQEKKAEELRGALVVAVTDLQVFDAAFRGGFTPAHFAISLAFQNKTDKAIQGVKGAVVFSDLFGDEVKTIRFSYDEGVPANGTASWDASLDYNKFMDDDKKLGNASLDKLKVTWMPDIILFNDGSSLSAK